MLEISEIGVQLILGAVPVALDSLLGTLITDTQTFFGLRLRRIIGRV